MSELDMLDRDARLSLGGDPRQARDVSNPYVFASYP
jgi:hypothetical protein